MSTYRELVSLVMDEVKLVSDDSHIQEEHVLFILGKLRVFLLKQRYSDIRKEIPDSNYQTVCLNLERTGQIDDIPCTGSNMLRSIETVPYLMQIGATRISTLDFFQGDFNYVNNSRFKYSEGGKYTSKQVYGTIAPDNRLYMRSKNPQLYYLEKVKLTGIFEDAEGASNLSCESTECVDLMDKRFPIEESLVTPLVELAVKEISVPKYQAEDNINNSSDDLSTIASYIRQQLAEGRRSDLYRNP